VDLATQPHRERPGVLVAADLANRSHLPLRAIAGATCAV
jgi:hypothetical protein